MSTILVAPERAWLVDAVAAGGAKAITSGATGAETVEAVVWTDPDDPDGLADLLAATPTIRWVQLPWAGIEPYAHVLDHDRIWTSGKDVYSEPVAEHALMLALAGLRGLGTYARADTWSGPIGRNLLGASVTIVGGGGIATSLLRLLGPFGCTVTVVRRDRVPLEGADRIITLDELDGVLPVTDVVFLAVALTPATAGMIDARRLDLLPDHAWIINVARGGHIVTDDLVAALEDGTIGGAALDVTDPEPLPDDHPLWSQPNCLITPHVGNTPEMAVPLLASRVTDNVRRWVAGDQLIGIVDVDAGY